MLASIQVDHNNRTLFTCLLSQDPTKIRILYTLRCAQCDERLKNNIN